MNKDQCIKCGELRYKQVGKSMVARKVLHHFPLILHMERMFSTLAQA